MSNKVFAFVKQETEDILEENEQYLTCHICEQRVVGHIAELEIHFTNEHKLSVKTKNSSDYVCKEKDRGRVFSLFFSFKNHVNMKHPVQTSSSVSWDSCEVGEVVKMETEIIEPMVLEVVSKMACDMILKFQSEMSIPEMKIQLVIKEIYSLLSCVEKYCKTNFENLLQKENIDIEKEEVKELMAKLNFDNIFNGVSISKQTEHLCPGTQLPETTDTNLQGVFDIKAILTKNTKCQNLIYNKLERNADLDRSELCLLSRTLCSHFTDNYKRIPNVSERENIAKLIVAAFPYLKKYSPEDGSNYPNYGIFFWKGEGKRKNSGVIENCVGNLRAKYTNDSAKKLKKSNPESPITEAENDMIAELSLIPSTVENKSYIQVIMKKTERARKYLLQERESLTTIIEMFPQYLEFRGLFVDLDFQSLFPDAGSIEGYKKYIGRALILSNKFAEVENKIIRSFLIVIDQLTFRGCKKTNFMHLSAKEQFIQEFIVWINIDVNVLEEIKYRKSSQPYLICQSKKSFADGQYFIVLDEHAINMGPNALKTFDILFKSFHRFGAKYPYPPSMQKFYEFMEILVYKFKKNSHRHTVKNLIDKLTESLCSDNDSDE